MSRIPLPSPESATGLLRDSYEAVRARFGVVPNGVRTIGVSPEALHGFLAFTGALAKGKLSAAERERVAILTAQYNSCGYCLSAHTLGGRAAGVSEADLDDSREGRSEDPRAAAILRFAYFVLDTRGGVSDAHLTAAQDAGLTDAELVEVIAEVAINTFSNYLNRFIQPEYDIPKVPIDRIEV